MQGEVIFNQGIDSNNPNTYKFDTCQHRSEHPEEYTTKTCCQSKTETGYICRKIPINGLQSYHCVHCPLFLPKEETPTQDSSVK